MNVLSEEDNETRSALYFLLQFVLREIKIMYVCVTEMALNLVHTLITLKGEE